MTNDDVSLFITKLGDGDEVAAQAIFDRYYERIVKLARRNLRAGRGREADEEDVAVGAMHSFFRGAREGRFPQLEDREDLWKILATITIRKASAQLRREHAARRDQRNVRGESIFIRKDQDDGRPVGFDGNMGNDPTPEFAALMAEKCDEMLNQLDDDSLRAVALYKLQGYTHKEIAEKLGKVEETVNRKVKRIRERWSEVAGT
ncbi:MAG: RNA polymerase subunit sigma-70 [Planctomycetota bacterium]|nr:MAG: RNA polymerase subunit sigma-70 [Planctomycetota bacterium]REJ96954.1 MAG: RNA polymerase subunit sigma-70 [Planctomycetota bacterium]REK26389.1 MAG: RNA polymerase subunit sigma-70 [Planctomycetota bacterium]REK37938.1 MAG: RNA polymerase subunit sigma-70 [Planctomycetota bacterium]